MRTDEIVLASSESRRELRVWRSSPDSYSTRIGIGSPNRRMCAAVVVLDPDALDDLITDLQVLARHARTAVVA